MTSPRKSIVLLLGLDTVSLFIVFNLVTWVRSHVSGFIFARRFFGGTLPALQDAAGRIPDLLPTPPEIITWPLFVPLLLLAAALYLIDGYRDRTDMMSLDYTSQHVIAHLAAIGATLLLIFVLIRVEFPLQESRFVVGLSFLLLIPVTLSYRRAVSRKSQRERRQHSIVYLGDPATGETFLEECRNNGMVQPVICTVVRPETRPAFAVANAPVRTFAEVLEEVQSGSLKVEAIVLRESGRDLSPQVAEELTTLYFGGLPTYTLELFHEAYWRKIPLYRLNQTWLFQAGFPIAREPVFERVKRILDVTFAGGVLLLASPFLLIASLLIKLDDGGPVLFRQVRIGRNRRPFRMLKLRTMKADAAEGPRYTEPGDARITRIGRFLRASRLDEVPQLWNVLRGDMSVIGPRAEWDRLVIEYEREVPSYHFRHLVKPGITGWAQVNYPYGTNLDDTRRKLEYDLYYIRHFSFSLDAAIVLKTVHLMLFGRGR